MSEPDTNKRPKPNAKDITHSLVKASLSRIPVIGGPASELFSLVITPSLEKRRDKWIESIDEGLKELETKVDGFKIENLRENEIFISTVVQAAQAAIRDHQKDKLEAFKNAVLNTTLPAAPDEDLRLMFLEFIDTLTPLHLKALESLNQPPWMKYDKFKEETFPKLTKHYSLCDTIVRDLYSRGLIDLQPPSDGGGNIIFPSERNTTDLGKAFLKFITSPFEEKE
jgi:hypothetical protein